MKRLKVYIFRQNDQDIVGKGNCRMAIPRYHEMYRPFLDRLKDEQSHKSKEIKEVVATAMSVTEEGRKGLLPSGKQDMFDNRIGWTKKLRNQFDG